MKIAITGDLHFSGKTLPDIQEPWQRMVKDLQKSQVDLLLIAGDVFDNANISSREGSMGTILHAFAEPLEQAKILTYIVEGNHDQAGANQLGALTPFILKGSPDYIWSFNRPKIIANNSEIAIAMLPWVSKGNLFSKEEYRNLPKSEQDKLFGEKIQGVLEYLKTELEKHPNQFKILLGHCAVTGSITASNYFIPAGSCEFTNSMLAGVGADLITIGHHHKRQGYYVGSPWQLNFGETGDPTGYRLIEIEDGKLISDEYIDDLDAPKYHIIKAEDYISGIYSEKDYVEIKGEKLPQEGEGLFQHDIILPANHRFKKVLEKTEIKIRAKVEAESSPVKLFETWAEMNLTLDTPENIITKLTEILSQIPAETSSEIGSLQEIHKIKIENIAKHKNTIIDYTGKDMIAFSGANGSGKTFALETPGAVFFGDYISRSGTIYDQMPLGFLGDSKIEVEFTSAGKRYIAYRELHKTEKTSGQKAWLYELTEQGEKDICISKEKTSDFRVAIMNLIGNKELFFASAFSSQNGYGDITQLDPAVRQEIFSMWLGLKKYSLISEKANDKFKELQGSLDTNKRTKESLSERVINEVEYNEQITFGKNKIEELKVSIEKTENILQEKIKATGNLEFSIRERQEKISALDKTKDNEKKLGEEKLKLTQEINADNELIKQEPEIQENLKKLLDLQYKKQQADEINIKYSEAQNVKSSLEKDIAFLENKIKEEKTRLNNEIQRQETALENHKKKAGYLDKAGCRENIIQDCPFISDAVKAKDLIIETEIKIESFQETVLSEDFAGKERKGLIKLTEQLKDLILPEKIDTKDLMIGIKVLGNPQAELSRIEVIKNQLDDKNNRLEDIFNKIENIQGEILELGEQVKLLPVNSEDEKEKLQKEIRLLNHELKDKRSDIEQQNKQIGSLEKIIEENKNKTEQLKTIESEIAQVTKDMSDYITIKKAFGKTGVPQLLIDNARPQIQDILDNLVNSIGDNLQITFDTQRLLKTGDMKETLDILITTEKGVQDIKQFSGGEQKLLRTIIRLALAIYQAQRTGNKYEVFCVDEVFDSLDKDNSQKVIQILQQLKSYFRQVMVVSHTDELLLDFPTRLNFTKNNNGFSEVEVIC